MATFPINYIDPRTNTPATYTYVAAAGDDNLAAGRALFNLLYPYPNPGSQPTMADESQWTRALNAEGNYADQAYVEPPYQRAVPAGTAIPNYKATDDWTNEINKLKNNYFERSITTYQRGWTATNGNGSRPLLATNSLVLCMGIVVYDPASTVAMMAHVDKSQKFETIADVVAKVFPVAKNAVPSSLDVHFYGGRVGQMETSTRPNLIGMLNALYKYNASFQLPIPRLTIKSFNVMGRPHNDSITFDASTGKIWPIAWGGPNNVSGFPLDSIFRYWPDGRYCNPAWDGPTMAQYAEDIPIPVPAQPVPSDAALDKFALKEYLNTIRCQWDGSPSGWESFFNTSNDTIARLSIQYALDFVGISVVDFPYLNDLTASIKAQRRPMVFEQSLKRWVSWMLLPDAERKAAGKSDASVGAAKKKAEAEKSLSFAVTQMKTLKKSSSREKVLAEFEAVLAQWMAKNFFVVPGEDNR